MSKKVTKKKTATTTRKKTTTKKVVARKKPAAAKARATAPVTPTEELIRARAFEIYRAGQNPSNPEADWFQAEQELREKRA